MSHHGEGANVTTAPSSHADSITCHMLAQNTYWGHTHSPTGWQKHPLDGGALVWTPCSKPQEGSPLALLEPILSSNHPMANCTKQT